MVNEVMEFITKFDPEVGQAIESEAARQRRGVPAASGRHHE